MRGPKGCHATNGHPRNYSASGLYGRHIGTFTIYSDQIIGRVVGVHVPFPRDTAANVLHAWRNEDYDISVRYRHVDEDFNPCGPTTCMWCNATHPNLQPIPTLV